MNKTGCRANGLPVVDDFMQLRRKALQNRHLSPLYRVFRKGSAMAIEVPRNLVTDPKDEAVAVKLTTHRGSRLLIRRIKPRRTKPLFVVRFVRHSIYLPDETVSSITWTAV